MIDLIDLYMDTNHYLRDDNLSGRYNIWTTSVNNEDNLASEQFWYQTGEEKDRFQVNAITNPNNDEVSYQRGWIYLKSSKMWSNGKQWLDRFEFTLNIRIFSFQPGMILHAGYDRSNPLDYCFYLWADAFQATSFNLGIWSKNDTYGATLNCTGLTQNEISAYPWMHIKVIGDGNKIALSIVEYPQYGEASIPFSMYNCAGGINLGQSPNSDAPGCAARYNSFKLDGSYWNENVLKVY